MAGAGTALRRDVPWPRAARGAAAGPARARRRADGLARPGARAAPGMARAPGPGRDRLPGPPLPARIAGRPALGVAGAGPAAGALRRPAAGIRPRLSRLRPRVPGRVRRPRALRRAVRHPPGGLPRALRPRQRRGGDGRAPLRRRARHALHQQLDPLVLTLPTASQRHSLTEVTGVTEELVLRDPCD